MTTPRCIAEADLRAYQRGELPERLAQAVTAHLEACASCEALARRLDAFSDSVLRPLRPSPGMAPTPGLAPAERPESGEAAPEIPGYKIMRELGRGGMSVVYLAQQSSPERLVALKVILGGAHAEPQRRARLRAEADAIARLNHPNIVTIYEIGEQAGLPYLSLEYVRGGSLGQYTHGTPQPASAAAALVETLACAMHAAHAAGVVHRDLKPANILLATSDFRFEIADLKAGPDTGLHGKSEILNLKSAIPKVTDFGLAKQARAELTATGAVLGTPSYMAPEQAAGDNAAVGPAADVYALGAILYELLTGRPPFQGSTVLDTLEQVRSAEPVPPRRLVPRLSADLETITLKCLEKDPARRYGAAAELADELRRFRNHEPIRARRIGQLVRTWRWCRRNPGWAAAAALLLVVAVGASLLAAGLNAALGRARQAEQQATNQLFESLLTQVRAGRSSGRPGQRLAGLQAIRQARTIARAQGRPEADLLQLRNEAVACLALPDLQLETQWQGNPPGTSGLGFDAAFERYAWSFKDEGIRVCRLKDQAVLLRLPTPPSTCLTRLVRFCFSPDGRYLAVFYQQWAGKHPLEVWDLSDGAGRCVWQLEDAGWLGVFAADSRNLLAPLPTGEVVQIELPSGRERRRLPSSGPVEALALAPGGQFLAVAGGPTEGARVLNLESATVVGRLAHPDAVHGLAWSPDGRQLVTACNDTRLYLWDARAWRKEGTFSGHHWSAQDVAFDPTGRWLASFGWDMTLRIWEVGSRRQVLHVEDVRVVSFRSQGGLAAAGLVGHEVQVWGFRPSAVFQEMHSPDATVGLNDFSPDYRWLATSGLGQDLRLWDLETDREVGHWPVRGNVLWGPDWTWFLTPGPKGFLRTPVRRRASGRGDAPGLEVGQPQRLRGFDEDVRQHEMTWVGADCRRMMLTDRHEPGRRESRVRLLELEGDTIRVRWEGQHLAAVGGGSSSWDGRLVATLSYDGGDGVRVWEADTGRLVRELAIGDAMADFSHDGRRLFTTTGRLSPHGAQCRSWSTESWEPDRAAPLDLNRTTSSPALVMVAADGTVAVTYTMSDVRLLDPETLAEYATLVAPEPGMRFMMRFSPDGATLATSASGTIHLWDLRRLRQELAELELDWNAPPVPPQGLKHP